MSRTFVTATAGMMYPRGSIQNEAATDAAFADLDRQVDELTTRAKEVMKSGVIEKMVADAIKPFEAAIRAKAAQIRNSSKQPVSNRFRPPRSTTDIEDHQERIANAERRGFLLPEGD